MLATKTYCTVIYMLCARLEVTASYIESMDAMGWSLMELGALDKGGYDSCLGHRLAEVTKKNILYLMKYPRYFWDYVLPRETLILVQDITKEMYMTMCQ